STGEALGFYDEAAAVADRLGVAVNAATWLAIHEARASLYSGLSDFRRAHAEATREGAVARHVGDPTREGEALLAMGWASRFLSDWPQAISEAKQGLDVATAASIPKVVAGAHSVIACVQVVTGRLEESRENIVQALALERTVETAPHQVWALILAGELHHWAG